eukprot:1391231-Pleurochrysis_carterae.AAC.2
MQKLCPDNPHTQLKRNLHAGQNYAHTGQSPCHRAHGQWFCWWLSPLRPFVFVSKPTSKGLFLPL